MIYTTSADSIIALCLSQYKNDVDKKTNDLLQLDVKQALFNKLNTTILDNDDYSKKERDGYKECVELQLSIIDLSRKKVQCEEILSSLAEGASDERYFQGALADTYLRLSNAYHKLNRHYSNRQSITSEFEESFAELTMMMILPKADDHDIKHTVKRFHSLAHRYSVHELKNPLMPLKLMQHAITLEERYIDTHRYNFEENIKCYLRLAKYYRELALIYRDMSRGVTGIDVEQLYAKSLDYYTKAVEVQAEYENDIRDRKPWNKPLILDTLSGTRSHIEKFAQHNKPLATSVFVSNGIQQSNPILHDITQLTLEPFNVNRFLSTLLSLHRRIHQSAELTLDNKNTQPIKDRLIYLLLMEDPKILRRLHHYFLTQEAMRCVQGLMLCRDSVSDLHLSPDHYKQEFYSHSSKQLIQIIKTFTASLNHAVRHTHSHLSPIHYALPDIKQLSRHRLSAQFHVKNLHRAFTHIKHGELQMVQPVVHQQYFTGILKAVHSPYSKTRVCGLLKQLRQLYQALPGKHSQTKLDDYKHGFRDIFNNTSSASLIKWFKAIAQDIAPTYTVLQSNMEQYEAAATQGSSLYLGFLVALEDVINSRRMAFKMAVELPEAATTRQPWKYRYAVKCFLNDSAKPSKRYALLQTHKAA